MSHNNYNYQINGPFDKNHSIPPPFPNQKPQLALTHKNKTKLEDLHNEKIFPPYSKLPRTNDLALEYYDFYRTEDGPMWAPRKHWCFLAEILVVKQKSPTRTFSVIVRDKEGQKCEIFFDTDDHGEYFRCCRWKRGDSIAVLYQHRGDTDPTDEARKLVMDPEDLERQREREKNEKRQLSLDMSFLIRVRGIRMAWFVGLT